jgi:zinc transport system permease protein
MLLAMGVGVLSAVSGLAGSFEYDLPPGPSIVLLALALFLAAAAGGTVVRRRRARRAGAVLPGAAGPGERPRMDAEAEVIRG